MRPFSFSAPPQGEPRAYNTLVEAASAVIRTKGVGVRCLGRSLRRASLHSFLPSCLPFPVAGGGGGRGTPQPLRGGSAAPPFPAALAPAPATRNPRADRLSLARAESPSLSPCLLFSFLSFSSFPSFFFRQGLYAGLTATLVEIIPYAALQFGLYDVFTGAAEAYR